MPEKSDDVTKLQAKEISTGFQESLLETIHLDNNESLYFGETVDEGLGPKLLYTEQDAAKKNSEKKMTDQVQALTNALPRALVESGICDETAGKRFEHIKILGQGGGGEVSQVRDLHLQRDVALKTFAAQQTVSPRKTKRFIDEARITAQLEHPNILPVHDLAKTEDGRLFYTMRQATGPSLRTLIRQMQDGKCPASIQDLEDRVEIMLRVCDAIAYAHNKGIIHQDIKPDNIMLGSFGEVLVVDWGTAIKKANNESVIGKMMGTPAYMSPEQARRESVDERSDIYCLGATMYQLCTGILPVHTGDEQTYFDKKRRGDIDPLPPAALEILPTYLHKILLKCLAADAAKRYQNVAALQEDLRSWQRNKESLVLTKRAEENLKELERHPDHVKFSQVSERFRQALEMWTGNIDARDGLETALLQHVDYAIRKHDYDVARSVLGKRIGVFPEREKLILKGEQAQLVQARRARSARLFGIAAICLIGVLIAYMFYENQRQQGEWLLKYNLDAASPHIMQELQSMDYQKLAEIETNLLSIDGVLRTQNHDLTVIKSAKQWGDVRIEAEIMWPEKVDGFNLLLRIGEKSAPTAWQAPKSYLAQFGGDFGTNLGKSFIEIMRTPGVPTTMHAINKNYEVGRWYRVCFLSEGRYLRQYVDDVLINERESLLPLGGPECNGVGFRSWGQANIRKIRIWNKRPAEKNSPVVSGDTLVANGLHEAAFHQYLALAEDFPNTGIEEESLAKAFVTSTYLQDQSDVGDQIMQKLSQKYPKSLFIDACFDAYAQQLWQRGKVDKALEICRSSIEKNGKSILPLLLLSGKDPTLSLHQEREFLQLLALVKNVKSLSFREFSLHSIEPLHGMNLEYLGLDTSRLKNIDALKGMRLVALNVTGNDLDNITAVKGMPLKELSIGGNSRITQLDPLIGTSLKLLDADGTAIESLEPLRGMPLERLRISRCFVADLKPLADVPTLTSLSMNGLHIKDLSPLRNLPLQTLIFNDGALENLEFDVIQSLPLVTLEADAIPFDEIRTLPQSINRLFLNASALKSIDDLQLLPNLNYLRIRFAKTVNIAELSHLPLRTLQLYDCEAIDLSGLEKLPDLLSIEIRDSHIVSGDIVAANKLNQVTILRSTLGSEVSINARGLKNVSIRECPTVKRFPKIKAPNIQDATLEGNAITSLDGFNQECFLRLAANQIPVTEINDLIREWTKRGVSQEKIDFLIHQQAFLNNDVLKMKKLAVLRNGYYYFNSNVLCRHDEALIYAQKFNAFLPWVADFETHAWFRDFLVKYNIAWLGLNVDEQGNAVWDCGQPFSYDRRNESRIRKNGLTYLRYFGQPVDRWTHDMSVEEPAVLVLMWPKE